MDQSLGRYRLLEKKKVRTKRNLWYGAGPVRRRSAAPWHGHPARCQPVTVVPSEAESWHAAAGPRLTAALSSAAGRDCGGPPWGHAARH
eukprot:747747-Hanusia_phi.AAC.6